MLETAAVAFGSLAETERPCELLYISTVIQIKGSAEELLQILSNITRGGDIFGGWF